ncbi:hypothetical protein [Cellulomonas septica]|uniref:Uncharacterized protein n=1 Tax=Cellulomonas septica TaxID=285080 RepID=A0ABX1K2K0_9CELL|nr:hypothetical protein [Cellulomonas septica]NKY39867.1 hypothetical protein [Cellulomonas septica]
MDLPPRLSAAQMLWWSVGLLVVATVVSEIAQRTQWFFGGGTLAMYLAMLLNVVHTLGVTGIVGAFVVRALEPRHVSREAPHNVHREQNV